MDEKLYTQKDFEEKAADAINSYATIHDIGLIKGGLLVVGATTVTFTVCKVVEVIGESVKERIRLKSYLKQLKAQNQR